MRGLVGISGDSVIHAKSLKYTRCKHCMVTILFQLRGFTFSLPRSFTFFLCGDVLVQEVLTVVEARPDWRYPALRLSLIFLPLSLPPY